MSGPTNALVDQLLLLHKGKTDAIKALRLEADRIASQIRDLEASRPLEAELARSQRGGG